MKEKGRKLVAQNKKARYDYSIEDVIEAGVVLVGTEVKSLREGRASLIDGFAQIKNDLIIIYKNSLVTLQSNAYILSFLSPLFYSSSFISK